MGLNSGFKGLIVDQHNSYERLAVNVTGTECITQTVSVSTNMKGLKTWMVRGD